MQIFPTLIIGSEGKDLLRRGGLLVGLGGFLSVRLTDESDQPRWEEAGTVRNVSTKLGLLVKTRVDHVEGLISVKTAESIQPDENQRFCEEKLQFWGFKTVFSSNFDDFGPKFFVQFFLQLGNLGCAGKCP